MPTSSCRRATRKEVSVCEGSKVPQCPKRQLNSNSGGGEVEPKKRTSNKYNEEQKCDFPRGPQDCKNSISRGNIEKSSFQYGMKFSIENEISIPGPSLAAEKQGLGLKFSIENEMFKPRMKISSENENFVRGGTSSFVSCVRARMIFFRSPGPLGSQVAITFKLLLGYFCVTLGSAPRVTFELLFRYFDLSRLPGPVGPLAPHKGGHVCRSML